MNPFLTEDFNGTFPFTPHLINLEQGKMCFIDEGEGDPLLFLHGNPTWSYINRHFITPLACHRRVIAPDHLGFGRSDKPSDAPYTLHWHIKNITEMIISLDLQNITLIVHDWGGPIGLGFATEHYSRIKRLVIFNSWAFRINHGTKLHPILASVRKPIIGERLVLEKNFLIEQGIPAGIYKKELITPITMNAYRAPFSEPNSRRAILELVRNIPLTAEHPSNQIITRTENRLHLLDIPVAIIWGTQDPVFPPTFVNKWKYHFPSAKVYLLSEASHFLQEDEPGQILSILQDFIDTN